MTEFFNDDPDLPLWRVGVVVFASVRAVDYGDGEHIVQRAVRQALGSNPVEVAQHRGSDVVWRVDVADVKELSTALTNGYAYMLPSTRAWREYRRGESGGLPLEIVDSWVPEEDE